MAKKKRPLSERIYSKTALYLGTIFGGPIISGILLRNNLRVTGSKKSGNRLALLAYLLFALELLAVWQTPTEYIFLINIFFTLLNITLLTLIIKRLQKEQLIEHRNSGGLFYPIWRVILMVFCLLIALFLVIFLYFWSQEMTDNSASIYDSGMTQIQQNEQEVIALYYDVEAGRVGIDSADLVEVFSYADAFWHENLRILDSLQNIENLPTELMIQNQILYDYYQLCVRHNRFQLIHRLYPYDQESTDSLTKLSSEMEQTLQLLEE